LVAPIGEVVAAFAAGAGMVGNLVGGQAGGGESPLGPFEQRGGKVLVGQSQLAARGAGGKGGAGLDRQLIQRQVLAGEGQGLVELVLPGGEALPRAGIDQVEGIAREPLPREADGGDRLGAVVAASKEAQRR